MELVNDEQKKAMLAAIIDSSDDAIISKNLESRVTSWNQAAERMFGYTEEEMVGQLIHRIIPIERQAEEDMIIASLKRGERIEHFETVRQAKSGRLLDISLTVSPIKDRSGKIIGASKIARDISLQKQAADRLRIINEVGQQVAAQLDVDKILQLVTDATTRLSGAAFGAFFYNKVDAKGETYMLYALSGASREHFEKFGMPRNTPIFATTFDGTGNLRSDDITKDPRYGHNPPHRGMPEGHLPVVSYLAVPVRSQTGVVMGGLFFGHPEPAQFNSDHETLVEAIANQATVALNNAKLYQEINALNSRKDEFIGFASHELKTPLTTVKGYLQLGNSHDMRVKEIYPKMIRQVERLEKLIADLLDISRIQSGNLKYSFERVSIDAIIKDSLESLDLADRKIITDLPEEELFITVDGQKMTQVMVNLLSNAAKYSAAGSSIHIAAAILGESCHIAVTDQGSGIPPEELNQIFNQFYRMSYNASSARGMGLGLYIAREIVEAHRGKLWAESEVGKGSTFHISVPMVASETIE